MKEGVKLVLEAQLARNAADQLGLKFQTLARYVKKIRSDPNSEVAHSDDRKVFSDQQEEGLENFLLDNSKMFYGLTTTETRKVAFEMAEINQINHPQNWKHNGMTGKD
ncbi:hypothetical protein PR048_017582 [Dryococelus australis]|uniref:Transposase n=1 Tax=Dryococelus australis TaxID=614101 RepID=A0ABQ9H9Z5_9NEOP|nr:hypothetical protein PR048_017582 [Dryococelus australis]